MKPRPVSEIRNLLHYTTEGSTLLAGDDHFDGHNHERRGRNTFLYRTPTGRFFIAVQTTIAGERDRIEPLTLEAAIHTYDALRERRVSWGEAFPGVIIGKA